MGILKMFSLPIFKKYRWAIVTTILLMVYSYSLMPIDPTVTVDFKLDTVVGMPEYHRTDTTQSSGMSFRVNQINLNCDLESLGGNGGCEFFSQMVNLNKQVRATYFWMPTRLGYHFKVLYSLEQDGVLIVSPDQLHEWHMRDYKYSWNVYLMTIWFLLILDGVFLVFEFFSLSEKITNYIMNIK
jgi:hypothetical protein